MIKDYMRNHAHLFIEGILPKGPYLPCVSMAGRALLTGYPRHLVALLALAKMHILYTNEAVIMKLATAVFPAVAIQIYPIPNADVRFWLANNREDEGQISISCLTTSWPAQYISRQFELWKCHLYYNPMYFWSPTKIDIYYEYFVE